MKRAKSNPNETKHNTAEIPEKLLTPVESTLVANMERVVELATTTHLGEAFNNATQPYMSYIAERMSLPEKQALLLSLFLEKSSDCRIMIRDFAHMLDCRTIRIISLMSEVDVLVARGFVRRRKESDGSLNYRMPMDVITAFKDNTVYSPEPTKGLTTEKIFDRMMKNLDKAFERRFIYKIEFARPSLEAKCSIWQSMIPSLTPPLAEQLAAEYDFSGEEPSSEQLHSMCRAEQLANDSSSRRRIEF